MMLLHHQIESIQYWKVSHLKYPGLLPNSPDAMDVSHLQKGKVADKKISGYAWTGPENTR